jgi:hypothetical protein
MNRNKETNHKIQLIQIKKKIKHQKNPQSLTSASLFFFGGGGSIHEHYILVDKLMHINHYDIHIISTYSVNMQKHLMIRHELFTALQKQGLGLDQNYQKYVHFD